MFKKKEIKNLPKYNNNNIRIIYKARKKIMPNNIRNVYTKL